MAVIPSVLIEDENVSEADISFKLKTTFQPKGVLLQKESEPIVIDYWSIQIQTKKQSCVGVKKMVFC